MYLLFFIQPSQHTHTHMHLYRQPTLPQSCIFHYFHNVTLKRKHQTCRFQQQLSAVYSRISKSNMTHLESRYSDISFVSSFLFLSNTDAWQLTCRKSTSVMWQNHIDVNSFYKRNLISNCVCRCELNTHYKTRPSCWTGRADRAW